MQRTPAPAWCPPWSSGPPRDCRRPRAGSGWPYCPAQIVGVHPVRDRLQRDLRSMPSRASASARENSPAAGWALLAHCRRQRLGQGEASLQRAGDELQHVRQLVAEGGPSPADPDAQGQPHAEPADREAGQQADQDVAGRGWSPRRPTPAQAQPPISAHSAGSGRRPPAPAVAQGPARQWLELSSRDAKPTRSWPPCPSAWAGPGIGTCRGPYRSIRSSQPPGPVTAAPAGRSRAAARPAGRRRRRPARRTATTASARQRRSCPHEPPRCQRRPGASSPPHRVPLIAGTPRRRRPPAARGCRDRPGVSRNAGPQASAA